MTLRSLSQTGFPRIAKNASQRPIGEGGAPAKRTRLAAFNDKQTERYLHPTKGWRHVSTKRSIAANITANVKAGLAPFSMSRARKLLALGRV